MSRRAVATTLLAYGLVVTTLTVAVGFTHGKPRPCRATFARVTPGMMREEVYATVGGPPGDYTPPEVNGIRFPSTNSIRTLGEERWLTEQGDFIVSFDATGRVESVLNLEDLYSPGPTRWERLCEWVTTGYDSLGMFGSGRSRLAFRRYMFAEPYDLDTLRDILSP